MQQPNTGGQPPVSSVQLLLPMEQPNTGGQPPESSKKFPVDPHSVIKSNADCHNLEKVGKLGCALAVYYFFGDDVLQTSTLHGKGKLVGLDKVTLARLTNTIRALPLWILTVCEKINI